MEMTIGANIKRLRAIKNITQEQLSVAMNVTCAAVSKWERGETYPDITLLQPLAYYFGVSLDELMGYNQEKIQEKINEVITLYRMNINKDKKYAREIIVKAYNDYPNDYWIMHYYMWNIGGEMAENDLTALIANKEEFLLICDKIIEGCKEEIIRLNAWNMRAKILYAEGKKEKALEIYHDKFVNWYNTSGQKVEQLFLKDTDEYYYWVRKNMYELVAFAGHKLASVIFSNSLLTMEEKSQKAMNYGKVILRAVDETGDIFFAGLAEAFLGRTRTILTYCDGLETDIVDVLDMNLNVAKTIAKAVKNDNSVCQAYFPERVSVNEDDFLDWIVNSLLNPIDKRHADLLENSAYVEVLNKYK